MCLVTLWFETTTGKRLKYGDRIQEFTFGIPTGLLSLGVVHWLHMKNYQKKAFNSPPFVASEYMRGSAASGGPAAQHRLFRRFCIWWKKIVILIYWCWLRVITLNSDAMRRVRRGCYQAIESPQVILISLTRSSRLHHKSKRIISARNLRIYDRM